MYCSFCGKEIFKEDVFCPHCGKKVQKVDKDMQSERHNQVEGGYEKEPSFAWAFFSFLFPFFGLIIFCVFQYDKPKRAKSAGKSALIGVIIEIVLTIISLLTLNLFK